MLPTYFLFGLTGLALGSFGNVLVLRILSGESLGGRSHCPACRRTLSAYDLIPLLSFVWLRGRCRKCKHRISLQYPAVELGSMILFLFALFLHPLDPLLAFLTASALYFLFLACVSDVLQQQLPDVFSVCIGIVGIPLTTLYGSFSFSLFGALVPLVLLGGQWVLTRGKSIGTGDIFLATAIGFWLGLRGAIVVIIVSYMVGAIIALFLLATRKLSLAKKRIAFAPFLGIATILTLLGVGDMYLRLVFGY